MSLFDRILTQPIFNLLAFIYNFVGDYGLAIIILTILFRLALWPLVKKQLHQTRVMREIQPELQKIKQRANGNKMLESTMMVELYREKNVKPFSSMLVMLLQLPIMIAIFRVIQIFSGGAYNQANGVAATDFIYPFLSELGRIPDLLSGQHLTMFGVIDLARTTATYWPNFIIAGLAAFFQYYQSKQLLPDAKNRKRLRDMFKEAADGKEIDQADMMMATSRNMTLFMPIMTLMISMAFPGAVVLYYATSSLIAIGQQKYILSCSKSEMEKIASKKSKTSKKSKREQNAKEAVIVRKKDLEPKKSSVSNGGKTVVRRIKAK